MEHHGEWMTCWMDDMEKGWHGVWMTWWMDDMVNWWNGECMTMWMDGMVNEWHGPWWWIDDTVNRWHCKWMTWWIDNMGMFCEHSPPVQLHPVLLLQDNPLPGTWNSAALALRQPCCPSFPSFPWKTASEVLLLPPFTVPGSPSTGKAPSLLPPCWSAAHPSMWQMQALLPSQGKDLLLHPATGPESWQLPAVSGQPSLGQA